MAVTTTYKPPQYSTNDLVNADQNAIRYLLNPNPDFSQVDNRAAAASLASGAGGGTMNQARQWKLRDSELINRYQIGHQMLEPYQQRAQQSALQTQSEAAQLNNIAAQGAEAMKQLQLQEQGLSARQSASERAALERAVLEGNQAMERLRTSEAGQNSRQQSELDARLGQFYLGEEGQNSRLTQTLAADRERQALSEAGQTSRQEAALRNQLEEARLHGDIEGQLQASRLLQQAQLQTQSERAQTSNITQQGQNQLASGRQQGIFDLARTQLNQPDPRSNPNWRPTYRTQPNPNGIGQQVIEVPDASNEPGNRLNTLTSSVNRILGFYGL
jgi:hypothetical protein